MKLPNCYGAGLCSEHTALLPEMNKAIFWADVAGLAPPKQVKYGDTHPPMFLLLDRSL